MHVNSLGQDRVLPAGLRASKSPVALLLAALGRAGAPVAGQMPLPRRLGAVALVLRRRGSPGGIGGRRED